MLGIQELGVDLVGRQVVLTDDEDLSRLVTRSGRFGGVYLLEELSKHPNETLVVFGPKHLDKSFFFSEQITFSNHPSCCCCSHESIVVDGLWKGLVKPFSPMLLGKFYVHIYMARRSTENYSLLPHPGH